MIICGLFVKTPGFYLDRRHFAGIPVQGSLVAPPSSPGAGWRCYPRFSLHTLVSKVVADSSHNLVYRDVVMGMQ